MSESGASSNENVRNPVSRAFLVSQPTTSEYLSPKWAVPNHSFQHIQMNEFQHAHFRMEGQGDCS